MDDTVEPSHTADDWRAENDRHRALYVEAVKARDDLRVRLHDAEAERDRLRGDAKVANAAADAAAEAVGNMAAYASETVAERDRWRAAFDRIALDPAEYRHALGHVATCDDGCEQCRRLAQQALDGGVDAKERAADILAERDRLRAVVSTYHTGLSMVVSVTDIDVACGYAKAALDAVDQLDVSGPIGGDDHDG